MRPRVRRARTADDLARQFHAEGWKEGAPPGLAHAEEVDSACLLELVCPCCGTVGARLRPFRRGAEYRAVAACACGWGCEW